MSMTSKTIAIFLVSLLPGCQTVRKDCHPENAKLSMGYTPIAFDAIDIQTKTSIGEPRVGHKLTHSGIVKLTWRDEGGNEYEAWGGPERGGGMVSLTLHSDGILQLHDGWVWGRLPQIRTNYVRIGSIGLRPPALTAAHHTWLVKTITGINGLASERYYLLDRGKYDLVCECDRNEMMLNGYWYYYDVSCANENPCSYSDRQDILGNADESRFVRDVLRIVEK